LPALALWRIWHWRPIALFVFEALFILGWMVVALFIARTV
jgi:hypothetical protein